jgi:hypothetical protein
MKTGTTIEKLLVEIARRRDAKADIVAPVAKIHMEVGKGDGLRLNVADKFDYGINGIAHGQIATYTGIPKTYYDRMMQADPKLLSDNVNAWFRRSEDKRRVRTLDGIARAFPSDSYKPLENEDLAEAAVPALLERGCDFHSCEITDKRLYIKAVDPKVNRELKAVGAHLGDGGHTIIRCLAPAVTIQNSEVSEGALAVNGGTYDGWCSNLATFKERSVRKYHVGSKREAFSEDIAEMLSSKSKSLADQALWSAIGDVVRGAFDKARFDALVDKIEGTQREKLDGDVVEIVTRTAKKFSMNEGQQKSVLDHLIKGGDLSRFGLHNAITRASQDIEDYDTATDFERFGAQIIELPANEWREIARVAA